MVSSGKSRWKTVFELSVKVQSLLIVVACAINDGEAMLVGSSVKAITRPVERFIESSLLIDSAAMEKLSGYGLSMAKQAAAIDDMVILTNSLLLQVGMWLVPYEIRWQRANEAPLVNFSFVNVNNVTAIDGYAAVAAAGQYCLNWLSSHHNVSIDHVHLLTGWPLAANGKILAGLTVYNAVCSSRSATIVSLAKLYVGDGEESRFLAEALAAALVHEIGHMLNIPHDVLSDVANGSFSSDSSCVSVCDEEEAGHCVMWPRGRHRKFAAIKWSQCSALEMRREKPAFPRDLCLANSPQFAVFGSPRCGDFVVDHALGEECDCGPPDVCASKCCDPKSCRRLPKATCAFGACCDQGACAPLVRGHLCRPAGNDCDLPEYCDGANPECPGDTALADGSPCAGNTAYCFNSRCRSVRDQCDRLLGSRSVTQANSTCLSINQTLKCSRLVCETTTGLNDTTCGLSTNAAYPFLNFSSYNAESQNATKCCHSASEGPDFLYSPRQTQQNLLYVEDGSKCDASSMCYAGECRSLQSLIHAGAIKSCNRKCTAAEACNNEGRCQRTSQLVATPAARYYDNRDPLFTIICVACVVVVAITIVTVLWAYFNPQCNRRNRPQIQPLQDTKKMEV